MYDFTMSKIEDLLNVLEDTCVTSPDFVKAKLNIQDELHVRYEAETNPSFRSFFLHAHTDWRKLGGRPTGTLKGYNTAIHELRSGMRLIESSASTR
jgi:hypothetical protein